MCLCEVDTNRKRNKIKDTIPEEGLEVYKIVGVKDGKYYPIYQKIDEPYEKGLCEADVDNRIAVSMSCPSIYYTAGFHFWMKKDLAEKRLGTLNRWAEKGELVSRMFQGPFELITCIVKKEWVTETGMDDTDWIPERALVSHTVIFPDPKDNE